MKSSLVIGQPSSITTGFTSQSVFSGLAILPIHVRGNTVFSSYTLTPTVSSGLTLGDNSFKKSFLLAKFCVISWVLVFVFPWTVH